MSDLKFRFAKQEDIKSLAQMNKQLIDDEKHRNKMAIDQLEKRMSVFLGAEYTGVIVSSGGEDVGYALYRRDPDWIYLRQLFVKRQMRRKGIGRALVEWLRSNAWQGVEQVRVEVLTGNLDGTAFWKSIGFREYCITMEMEV